MQNSNSSQNYNFSNNVKQFELNEARRKMGISQVQGQVPVVQQKSNQLNKTDEEEFNTLF
ncbi:MAG: hypothetical protein KBA50_05985 [Sedimentibacter sp.]|nr:hypothetical protein [Sedimentibacter sp.]